MLREYSFTEARANFTFVVDHVLTSAPQIVKRRKKTEHNILLIDVDTQKELLATFSLRPEYIDEDDGSVTLALDSIDLYANGETEIEARKDMLEQIKVYTEEYLSNLSLYKNSFNKKSHYPYVMRIALCDSDEELENLLDA